MGRKGERKFRIVVQEKRSRRDGEGVDLLGFYEMGPKGKKQINKDRFNYWVSKGAKPSATVAKLV